VADGERPAGESILRHAAPWRKTAEPIKIGGMCDRTGVFHGERSPYLARGRRLHALVNRTGGVLGHKLSYSDIDHAYMVPRASTLRPLQQDGVVTLMTYGVPALYGLSSRLMEDRIPAFNTGTGRSDAIDGVTWPYIFHGTASYWSQAGVAMKYIKDNGAKRGTKVAFCTNDNPAGLEGLPMVEDRQKGRLRPASVCSSTAGPRDRAQANDIAQAFKADWVLAACS
jgi:branched-chain amino acid transport system substrate-binding protein